MSEPSVDIRCGDVREMLQSFPEKSAQMVITSPPYWSLRNYQAGSQELGSEETFGDHLRALSEVFSEVHRVLRDDGTLWLNYGDRFDKHGNLMMMPFQVAYMLQQLGWFLRCDVVWHKPNPTPESVTDRPTRAHEFVFLFSKQKKYFYDVEATKEPYADSTLKEAQTDYTGQETKDYATAKAQQPSATKRRILESIKKGTGRRRRDVWSDETAVWNIPVQPYRGGHFATFPERLVEPCVLAGTSGGGQCGACGAPYRRVVEKEPLPDDIKAKFAEARRRSAEATGRTDGHTQYKPNFRRSITTLGWEAQCQCGAPSEPQIVLDPFTGSGRAGVVARRLGRSFAGCELNPDYVGQALENILSVDPPAEEAA